MLAAMSSNVLMLIHEQEADGRAVVRLAGGDSSATQPRAAQKGLQPRRRQMLSRRCSAWPSICSMPPG